MVAQQGGEQGALQAGERDAPAFADRQQRLRLVAQAADVQRLQLLRGVPGQRAQARIQFAHGEGLDHVVVRAFRVAAQLVVEGVARGQHQHRHAVAGLAQPAAELEPVEPGQAEVEHDGVERIAQRARKAAGAVRAMVDLVAAAFQEVPDVGGDVVLVFDHQHAQAGDRIDGRGGHMDGDLLRAACHATRRGC